MAVLTTGKLPVRLTPLVGREAELGEVNRALAQCRMLTLTGPGGAGKTRLALAVATRLAAADGAQAPEAGAAAGQPTDVAWVELAPLTDPQLIAPAVAATLGVPETPEADQVAAIAAHLSARGDAGGGPVLLVLDNCEHLAAAGASLAERLLADCPALRILATSREPLGVEGERSWPVPPLGPGPRGHAVPGPGPAGGAVVHHHRRQQAGRRPGLRAARRAAAGDRASRGQDPGAVGRAAGAAARRRARRPPGRRALRPGAAPGAARHPRLVPRPADDGGAGGIQAAGDVRGRLHACRRRAGRRLRRHRGRGRARPAGPAGGQVAAPGRERALSAARDDPRVRGGEAEPGGRAGPGARRPPRLLHPLRRAGGRPRGARHGGRARGGA